MIPPERVFSILNDTFDDDMDNSHADYIELSLQLQFNSRTARVRVRVCESVRDGQTAARRVRAWGPDGVRQEQGSSSIQISSKY